jgi:hypothetical protein
MQQENIFNISTLKKQTKTLYAAKDDQEEKELEKEDAKKNLHRYFGLC